MSLCRTCFDICETDYSCVIEKELRNMLIFCIPELDLDITENPVLCQQCQTTLISVNEFKKKCLHTQQKILIFKNQAVKCIPTPVKLVPVLPKVVEKVSPFKLKFKNIRPNTSGTDNNNSKNQNVDLIKKSYQEYQIAPAVKDERIKASPRFVTDPEDNDQEDFLSLLDDSDNVSNPKMGGLSNLNKTDVIKNKPGTSRGFDCKLCKKSYKNKYHLKTHKMISVEHRANMAKLSVDQTTGQRYKCDSCSFSTKYKIGLNKHYPNCPNKKTISNSPRDSNVTKNASSSLRCKICSYMAFNNAVLARHMSRTHNLAWATHKCNRCTYHTTTNQKLREHNARVHNIKKNSVKSNSKVLNEKKVKIYTCSYSSCGKGFMTRKGWIYHEKIYHEKNHLPERRECPICKKQFENSRGFQRHVDSHIGSAEEASRKPLQGSVQKTSPKKRLSKEITDTTNDLVMGPKNIPDEANQMSGLQEIIENSQAKNQKENEDDMNKHNASQIEKCYKNERPRSEVQFYGEISDDENNSQMAPEVKSHVNIDTVFPRNEFEEEDQGMGILSQETIILDQDEQ